MLNPKVSVCVITYNSGKTIIDTLDSIAEQTYPDIELVVSDDCSTDNTLALCQDWIEGHRSRFLAIQLLTSEKNAGVAHNLNQALRAASGEWMKTLAGDDLLMPGCIQDNIDFISENEHSGIVFSKYKPFRSVNGQREVLNTAKPVSESIEIFNRPVGEQYLWVLSGNLPPSITAFIRKDLLIQYPFPEQYPFCEDYPQWLYLTRSGIKLSYFDTVTVLYRLSNSLTRTDSGVFLNEKFHNSKKAVFYTDVWVELSKADSARAVQQQKEFFLGDIAIILLKNRNNLFTRLVLSFFKVIVGCRKLQ